MATRLGLVGCKGPYEGVWHLAKGNEVGIEIYMLGKGGLVRYEWMAEESIDFMDFYVSGSHPLPDVKYERYRVSKPVASDQATIVRIQLNGQS